jgi:hypothetical protein
VPADEPEEIANDDGAGDKGDGEAERNALDVLWRQVRPVLVEVVGECSRHGRHRQEEGEFRGGALVRTEQERRHDRCAGARYARHQCETLREPDQERRRDGIVHHVVIAGMELHAVDGEQNDAAEISVVHTSQGSSNSTP